MKHIALTTILLAGILTVRAQSPALIADQATSGPSLSNENTAPTANEMAMNIFSATTMELRNNIVRFSNIPEDHVVKAYVTNAEGEMLKNKRLTASNNTIDFSRMHAGLYYITLMNKNKRKCFKVNI